MIRGEVHLNHGPGAGKLRWGGWRYVGSGTTPLVRLRARSFGEVCVACGWHLVGDGGVGEVQLMRRSSDNPQRQPCQDCTLALDAIRAAMLRPIPSKE